jgi:hypothetical protein
MRVRVTNVTNGKATSNKYERVCILALLSRHAKRMRRSSAVACPALQYFSTLSHKQHNFLGEKITEHKIRVLILSTTFV